MQYLFKRDTIFSTLFVFIILGVLAIIPFNTHVLDPIKLGLTDFDFTDITYAKLGKGKNSTVDSNVVIINVEDLDRAGINDLLTTIKGIPKVTGLDVLFEEKKDEEIDSALAKTIKNYPNIVIASRLIYENKKFNKTGYFNNHAKNTGFVNFIGEENATIRKFTSQESVDGKIEKSFAVKILELYNPQITHTLEKRNNKTEDINYKRTDQKYMIASATEILTGEINTNILKNKIVLIGYVGKNQFDIEDKHFTPMNTSFVGKSVPDMNGVVIHGNIISMINEHNYLNKIPLFIFWIVAFVICWLHMSFFMKDFLDHHIWYHLKSKTIQIISAILFVYLEIIFFQYLNIKINMAAILVLIVLSVDALYFYEAIALWLHKKWKYKTLFAKADH